MIVCFRGELRRTNLCGTEEVILSPGTGAYLDDVYLDEFFLDDEGGESNCIIDRPEFQKPHVYYEIYLDEDNHLIQNSQVMTW